MEVGVVRLAVGTYLMIQRYIHAFDFFTAP